MLSKDTEYLSMNDSLARRIKAKVGHYKGSTLLRTYSHEDAIQNIHVERAGESGKFFGFGVCQKLTLKLIDNARQLTVAKGEILKLQFNVNDGTYLRVCPEFVVDAAVRDEKTNVITITAYDRLSTAANHKLSDLELHPSEYTPASIISKTTTFLGIGSGKYYWSNNITATGNFSGEETLREVLNDIAEASQTVYFIDYSSASRADCLYFKNITATPTSQLTIRKNQYFELKTEPTRTLTNIYHITALDSVKAGTDDSGSIQYIKDNAFLNNNSDLYEVLTQALNRVKGMQITPFSCTWRGNFALQIGDCIGIEDKNGGVHTTYIFNDSFEYSGGFKQTDSWSYEEEEVETPVATTISQKMTQTSATVDRVKNEVTLLTSSVYEQGTDISQLQMTDNSIKATVESLQTNTKASIDGVNEELSTINRKLETTMTSEEIGIQISETIANGVESVTTSTGFTFNDEGLHISKSTSDMESLLDETGLTVSRRGTEMLKATSDGVDARNLTAQEFLRIENVRFERYNRTRMGCFWVGG